MRATASLISCAASCSTSGSSARPGSKRSCRAIGKPFTERYHLQEWRVGHAELALRHRAPVVPVPEPTARSEWLLQHRRTRSAQILERLDTRGIAIPDLTRAIYTETPTTLLRAAERNVFTTLLSDGFNARRIPSESVVQPEPQKRLRFVSWSNHLSPEASEIKMEAQRRALAGEPASAHLAPEWRERFEDMVWALFNSPEFLFVP